MFIAPENKDVKAWLEKPETLAMLRRIATALAKQFKNDRLAEYVYTIDEKEYGNRDLLDEKIRVIESRLAILILEREEIQRVLMEGKAGSHAFLKKAFRNSVIDTERQENPFKKLYRNLQAGIRQSALLETEQDGARSPVYLYASGSGKPRRLFLCGDDLAVIPFPLDICGSLDYAGINRKEVLVPLALRFLREMSEMNGVACPAVTLREFILWIMRSMVPETLRQEDLGVDADGEPRSVEVVLPDESVRETDETLEAAGFGAAFAARLGERERQVFALLHCRGMTLTQFRDVTGEASLTSYWKKKIEDRLRHFLAPCPWKNSLDAFGVFVKQVCEKLGES
jgi:hypothetical protein